MNTDHHAAKPQPVWSAWTRPRFPQATCRRQSRASVESAPRAAERGFAWPTGRPSRQSGDQSPHSTIRAAREASCEHQHRGHRRVTRAALSKSVGEGQFGATILVCLMSARNPVRRRRLSPSPAGREFPKHKLALWPTEPHGQGATAVSQPAPAPTGKSALQTGGSGRGSIVVRASSGCPARGVWHQPRRDFGVGPSLPGQALGFAKSPFTLDSRT